MKYLLILLLLLVSVVVTATPLLGLERVTCNATATQLPNRSAISFSVAVPVGGDTVYFGAASTLTTANGIAAAGFNDIKTGNTSHLWCRTSVADAGQSINLEFERYP